MSRTKAMIALPSLYPLRLEPQASPHVRTQAHTRSKIESSLRTQSGSREWKLHKERARLALVRGPASTTDRANTAMCASGWRERPLSSATLLGSSAPASGTERDEGVRKSERAYKPTAIRTCKDERGGCVCVHACLSDSITKVAS